MQFSAALVTLAFASVALANPMKRQEDQNAQLDGHNKYRAIHHAPALTWDDGLANDAATVAATCSFEHSGGPHGENLFAGTTLTDQQAIDGWYSEGEQYDYNNPGFNENTGHFTQVVWKDSTRLGCARKDCGGDLGFFIVCEYEPRGNIVGNNGQYFRDNVLPA